MMYTVTKDTQSHSSQAPLKRPMHQHHDNSQGQLKRTMPRPITPAKRPRNAPAPSTPNMPIPSPVIPLKKLQIMLQPLTLDPRLDMPTLSPVTPLGKPQSPSQSPPKLTLKSVSIRRKRVHKRVQVDEEQAEALESEDESDKMPRFKLPDDKNVSHIENGTQVVEDNFCEVCHQMKIKQEIKDTGGITVKQEQISIEHESGMSGNAFHDVPAPSQASPSRDGQSRTPPNNSNFFQKIFESLIRERKFYKQELERMKEEQAKQVQGLSVNHLTKKVRRLSAGE
ncbi:uncharacterized protein [Amphiura filiformis]|uniref:uncharacterized protein n=1 Tax=Amphiura filiformis TaxID=82378 RepID=UPI003B20DFEA